MTLSIRIGSGMGFYGGNWEPVVASIERGQVQFIASDHLAELTLAILQKDRQRDPTLGYARDVLPMLMRLWPLMQPRGVRFVSYAGGLKPMEVLNVKSEVSFEKTAFKCVYLQLKGMKKATQSVALNILIDS